MQNKLAFNVLTKARECRRVTYLEIIRLSHPVLAALSNNRTPHHKYAESLSFIMSSVVAH